MTVMRALSELGQSVWLDYLHRDMTRSGELERMVHDGLRGVTSNPTIFERALAGSDAYDRDIGELADSALSDHAVYETLAIQDVQEAADVLLPVYRDTGGEDGFVSLEVSPEVARDATATVAEARRLWQFVNRPNVMIKIPGTRESWPAIERSLRDGININATLLFSLEHYEARIRFLRRISDWSDPESIQVIRKPVKPVAKLRRRMLQLPSARPKR